MMGCGLVRFLDDRCLMLEARGSMLGQEYGIWGYGQAFRLWVMTGWMDG